MLKILAICWKDIQLTLRDRAALLLMLAAPIVLTLGLGAVTGSFSTGSSTGLQEIPVVLVNQDKGQFGEVIVDAFKAEGAGGLFAASTGADPAAARQQVEQDQAAAAVIIPAGFSAGLLPDPTSGQAGPAAPLEVYQNPARPISASVVQSAAAEIVQHLETGPISGRVVIGGLLESGRLAPEAVPAYAGVLAGRLADGEMALSGIDLQVNPGAQPIPKQPTNFLSYLAPGMAVFFLMYTVTQGGRSLLAERDSGTLARLVSTPTIGPAILAGKILSIFVTGLVQVGVLILAASLLFKLNWGAPSGVILLVAAVSAAATGWGILLAAAAATPFQVSSVGTALMLFFGLLGGSLMPTTNFSAAVRLLGKLTPNAWALEGFTKLSQGGSLSDLAIPLAALTLMAVALFGLAVLVSRRRWATGFRKA